MDAALAVLARDDWVAFFRAKRHAADGHGKRLLEFAEDGVRHHLLMALARAYLSVPLGLPRGLGSHVAGRCCDRGTAVGRLSWMAGERLSARSKGGLNRMHMSVRTRRGFGEAKRVAGVVR